MAPRGQVQGGYTKGVVTQVIKKDKSGFPLEWIETDTDGKQWHVTEGEDPTEVRDADEVRGLAAESSQRGGNGGDGENGEGG